MGWRSLDRLAGFLARVGAVLAAVLVVAITGIVGFAVVMRYVLNQPQSWTDELVSYLLVMIIMLGAAEVLRRGEHIAVDILTERLSPRARRWVEVWGMAAVLFVAVVVGISGWKVAAFSRMMGIVSEGYMEVPIWLPQTLVPIGMAMLGLAALARLLQLLVEGGGPRP